MSRCPRSVQEKRLTNPGSTRRLALRARSDNGDTLIEVLLALLILSIASVALIIAFSTSISASSEHRNITNVGDLLTTISQDATSQMQLAAQSGLFSACSPISSYTSALDLSADIPSQYVAQYTASLVTPNPTAGLYPVEWWNGTSTTPGTAFISSCGVTGSTLYANQPQLLTIEVTNQTTGRIYYNSFVVTLPQSSEGTAVATSDCTSVALKWITQPGAGVTTPADTPLGEFTMELVCADGAASADDASSVSWALGIPSGVTDPAGATLSGCAGTNVNGYIYVTGCTVNEAGTYDLVPSDAADTTIAGAQSPPVTFATTTSSNFVVGAGGLSLKFERQPNAGPSGSAFNVSPAVQPVVWVVNANGTEQSTWSGSVTLTSSGGTASKPTLSCPGMPPNTWTGTVVSGADSFTLPSNCTFSGGYRYNAGSQQSEPTSYTLTATATPNTGFAPVEQATSQPFSVSNTGPASQLVFSQEPTGADGAKGATFAVEPQVTIEDAFGNQVTSNTGYNDTVKLTVSTGTLTCTSDSVAATNGVATFASCADNTYANGVTITAQSTGLTSVQSLPFNLTPAPNFLEFTTEPVAGASGATLVTEPVIAIYYSSNGTATGTLSLVTAESSQIGLTASGGLLTTCSGLVPDAGIVNVQTCAFAGLVGTQYTLTASLGSSPTATSTDISPTVPGVATQLVFTTEPGSTLVEGADFGAGPVVSVEDSGGNVVISSTATVAMSATPSTGIISTGCANLQVVAGVVNMSDCTFSGVGGTVYSLVASSVGLSSAQSTGFTLLTPPAAPGAPVVATLSSTSVSLTWTAPSNGGSPITGYVVDDTNVSISASSSNVCTGSETSTTVTCTVTGLTTGDSYTFTVAAINAEGTGTFSSASSAVSLVTAGAPAAPTATVASGTSATLTWTAPSDSGPAITGYQVNDTNTTTSTAGTNVCTGSTTSTSVTCTVTGLTTGDSYTFTVAAINVVGTGTFSPASSAVSLVKPGTPAAPSAVVASGTSATLTWTAPSDSGPAITGYQVNDTNTTTSTAGTNVCTGSTTSTSVTCTVTGLTTGDSYTFTVAAINVVGTGTFSSASSALNVNVVPGTPAAPTASVASTTSANITWTAPSDSGTAITGYQVNDTNTTTSAAGTNVCTGSTTSTSVTCTVTGLTTGDSYTFTVAAINAKGTGTFSPASSPLQVNVVPGTPGAPSGTGASSTSVALAWTTPSDSGTAITGYQVNDTNTTTSTTGTNVCTGSKTSTSVTCTVTGLTTGDSYTFTVAAINAEGTGAFSSASNVVALVKAGTPAAPSAVVASGTSATLTWTTPSDSGPAITGYQVNDTNTTTSTAGTNVCTGSTTSTSVTCTVTSLTAGNSYTFTVAAINAVGTGTFSSASNAVTPNALPGTPASPTATGATSTSITVAWTAPADTGSAITGYQVNDTNTTTSTAGTNVCTGSKTSTALTCTVTGLTTGDSYTFTVAAINADGTGTFSSASNVVALVKAGTPAAPSAVVASGTTVTVSWVAPTNSGPAITGYQINDTNTTTSTAGTNVCTGSTSSNAVSCTVTGLTTGDSYTFTVAAINAVGTGSFSAASSSVSLVTPAAPAQPTTTAVGTTEIIVTWTAPSDLGPAITGYVVSQTAVGGATTTVCSGSTTSTAVSCTVTGLSRFTYYTYTVSAINLVGTGPSSPASAQLRP